MPRIIARHTNSQMGLLPDSPPAGTLRDVPVAELSYNLRHVGDDLTDSIRRLGVITPIAVIEPPRRSERGPYRVAMGHKRARAAAIIGMDTIPAIVYSAGTHPRTIAAMAMAENAHRASSPIADLQAIESMVRSGYSVEDISSVLGLSESLLRGRMRLASLIPDIRTLLANGKLSLTLANQVTRWSAEDQRAFYLRVWQEPRVLPSHVRDFLGERQQSGPVGRFSPDSEEMFQPEEMGSARPTDDRTTFFLTTPRTLPDGRSFLPLMHRGEEFAPLWATDQRPVATQVVMQDIAEGEGGWEAVLRLLQTVDQLMPMSPNDDTDRFFVGVNRLIELARRQAGRAGGDAEPTQRAEDPARGSVPAGQR
jgi:ParB/RepB/Spo0J family partition protein